MKDLGSDLSHRVLGCAIDVHREIGPGLLEEVYETCLAIALDQAGISFERQKLLPVVFRGQDTGKSYRIDFLIEGELVVELKSVEKLLPIHQAQTLTYMRLLQKPLGLLINFNEVMLRDGIKRLALSAPSAPLRLTESSKQKG